MQYRRYGLDSCVLDMKSPEKICKKDGGSTCSKVCLIKIRSNLVL